MRAPTLLQLLDRGDEQPIGEESQETRQWRIACLKQLEASKKKPGFTKWAAVARAFTLAENEPSSMEPDVTLGLQQQSPGLAALKLKSNVDSFSSICDVQRSPERRRSTAFGDVDGLLEAPEPTTPMITSASALKPVTVSKAKRKASSAAKNQRGSVVLNDTLSRHARPATTQASSSSSLLPPNGNSGMHGSGGLWRYERQASSASSIGSPSSSASVTPVDDLTFDLATLANSPSALASGVALARGDAMFEGPERVDSPNNMSRKRFDVSVSSF